MAYSLVAHAKAYGISDLTTSAIDTTGANLIVIVVSKWWTSALTLSDSKGNNWTLNAFEKAQKVNGKRDSRHRDEHTQTLQSSDIPRFAELGVIASMQPTHCISDKKFVIKRILSLIHI